MRETGAAGFAFFRKDAESAGFLRQAGCGALIAGDDLHAALVARYPLEGAEGSDGVLAFAFPDGALLEHARPRLDRMAAAIGAVWAAAPVSARYAEVVNRVVELEAQLIDSKIAERARGFLENGGGPDVVETITQHVERVLRPAPTRRILEQILHELEEEIEARALAARAKLILQSAYAMSEEQAHAHLRTVSRRSRMRLRDVAEELIAQPFVEGGRQQAMNRETTPPEPHISPDLGRSADLRSS
jgi:hypothetical protein